MPRQNDRTTHLTLEGLESRNLQSALGTGQPAPTPLTPNTAVISPASNQLQANIQYHNYHTAVGFFGQ